MKPEWTVETLKELLEKILDGDRRANDQRFRAQEEAVKTAEHNRDIAINKAEASIEKKSDAVYVKLSDLSKAFEGVMPRSEAESRFASTAKDIAEIKKVQDQSVGKGQGISLSWGILLSLIGLIGGIIGILYAYNN